MIDQLIIKHRNTGIVVDANLLVLHVVGRAGRDLITRCKRTEVFTPEDFDLLQLVLKEFRSIITTPHILTEVSNLTESIKGDLRRTLLDTFVLELNTFHEQFRAAEVLTGHPGFRLLGLSDTGIADLAQRSHLVITVDFLLYAHLVEREFDVINFNHLRTFFNG